MPLTTTHMPPTPLSQRNPHARLLALFWPEIEQALGAVLARCSDVAPLPEADVLAQLLLDDVQRRLLDMTERTLVMELNVARLRKQLSGETPQARFNSFVIRLYDADFAVALRDEYAVLTRMVGQVVNDWEVFSAEWLTRLVDEWTVIQNTIFGQPVAGQLGSWQRAGDPHRRGRTVMLLTFTCGQHLVYKPRSLKSDALFGGLLDWLNERGQTPALHGLRVINSDTHGWVQFAAGSGCNTVEQLSRFYQRHGSLLAILYALNATDCHFENIIAMGEHPVLVDLESLCHAAILHDSPEMVDFEGKAQLHNSVLRVGLLPQRSFVTSTSNGVDLSGLSADPTQLSPANTAVWDHAGTDESRLTQRKVILGTSAHLPTLDGSPPNVLAHQHDVLRGFSHTYNLLLTHRTVLLAPDGPLMPLADTPVRFIARATRVYGKIRFEGFHPNLLRNAADRSALLDKLWLEAKARPELTSLISAEINDLNHSDIPYFTVHPHSRDLWDSAGNCYVDFFDEAAWTAVVSNIQQMGPENLERQQWIIRASFASLIMNTPHASWTTAKRPPMTGAATQPVSFLEAAADIGARLDRLALQSDSRVSWLGLTLAHEDSWMLSSLGVDLYAGIPGIALFLAYLGTATQASAHTQLAEKAIATLLARLEKSADTLTAVGAFGGWGGIIYTLTHCGSLLGRNDWLDSAERYANRIPRHLADDATFDIIGGAAGAILSLLALHAVRPSAHLLRMAEQCANHLRQHAHPQDVGLGWPRSGMRALAGLSHGAAGIALALHQLAAATGNHTWSTLADGALAYERHLFDAETSNWPDLRQSNASPMCAWCHGAPGIGLSRVGMMPHDNTMEIEIAAALATTINAGLGHNHSLCHGDLGNLDLLVAAAGALNQPHWLVRAHNEAARIVTEAQHSGWQCGVPGGAETPGFMTGLAGIGFQLLRLAMPDKVPSILMLAPPHRPQ